MVAMFFWPCYVVEDILMMAPSGGGRWHEEPHFSASLAVGMLHGLLFSFVLYLQNSVVIVKTSYFQAVYHCVSYKLL